jgi:hypothetical protein
VLVVLILVVSGLIFRGLGFAGVRAFTTWQESARATALALTKWDYFLAALAAIRARKSFSF